MKEINPIFTIPSLQYSLENKFTCATNIKWNYETFQVEEDKSISHMFTLISGSSYLYEIKFNFKLNPETKLVDDFASKQYDVSVSIKVCSTDADFDATPSFKLDRIVTIAAVSHNWENDCASLVKDLFITLKIDKLYWG
jgi:hypothetical protein